MKLQKREDPYPHDKSDSIILSFKVNTGKKMNTVEKRKMHSWFSKKPKQHQYSPLNMKFTESFFKVDKHSKLTFLLFLPILSKQFKPTFNSGVSRIGKDWRNRKAPKIYTDKRTPWQKHPIKKIFCLLGIK